MLGANGMIYLVPDTAAFTLEVQAMTADSRPLPRANIEILSDSGLAFTSLTALDGTSRASLDAGRVYDVRMSFFAEAETVLDVTSTSGDTLTLVFQTLTASDVDGFAEDASSLAGFRIVNSPNPFSHETRLQFSLPALSNVVLSVFNAEGRQIKTLASGSQPAGMHRDSWDGTDRNGMPVGAGVYFARLQVGDQVTWKKMLLVR